MLHRKNWLLLCLGFTLLAGITANAAKPKPQRLDTDNHPLPEVPPVKAVPIDPALQSQAAEVLKSSLISTSPVIRAHAVETAEKVYRDKAASAILAALSDPEPVVRFAGAIAVGDLKLTAGRDEVFKHLNDGDPNVQVAVRFALHMLGDTKYSHDLEKFARDPEKGVRGNTAFVLGRTGNASAATILLFLERDREATVRLQAAEALWRLGDDRGLRTLVAASVSGYTDDIVVAMLALAGPKLPAIRGHLQDGLTSEYPEIALVAARALGQLGFDSGFGVAVNAAQSREPARRYLAAMALGDIGRPDGQDALKLLLAEKDNGGFPTGEDIRLAAACSLLQIGNK
jgi:HEAT repeat protein